MSNATAQIMLPPQLLHEASQANGKLVLVLGAGCSFEQPTSVPMAKKCSRDAYERLVADGILAEGDCANPDDLSALADTVYAKQNGRQAALVERLPRDRFRRARANLGYLTAAALLRENVISSILTLNYDLAMETALTELSAFDVQKIARPEDMQHFSSHNVVYLHRNVDERDLEAWVLRASALESEWQNGWEGMIVQVMLTCPVVVFAGLGSPAAVLIETTKRIKSHIGGVNTYQVDPFPAANNTFFQALGIAEESFVQLGWNDFMVLLGNRVLTEQLNQLRGICNNETQTEGFQTTKLDFVIDSLRSMGLVEFGKVRSKWLLERDEVYAINSPQIAVLISHLIIAASAIAQVVDAIELVSRSQVVEFRGTSGELLTSVMMASGRGIRGWIALEAAVSDIRKALPRHEVQPRFAVIAGAIGSRLTDVATPSDITFGELLDDDILLGEPPFVLIDAHELCVSPQMLRTVI